MSTNRELANQLENLADGEDDSLGELCQAAAAGLRAQEAEITYLRDALQHIAGLGGAQGVVARSALTDARHFKRSER